MRELRIQHRGKPLRVLYAFNPRRTAIVLIGGAKFRGSRFYREMVPIADAIYDLHIAQLKDEGSENG